MKTQEFESLVDSLAETPAAVRRAASDLTAQQLTYKPSEKEFSFLENVCHLRDIEQEGYAFRIRKILSDEDPLLPDIDGGRLAIERDYNRQNLDAALGVFSEERARNVSLLRSVSVDQLKRGGLFETVGPVTLESLLLMMREHDLGHLKDLSELRRLLDQK